MGANCCVAARDRTINHGSSGEIVQRNIRNSASWSLRWDSRVGVAGEDTSVGWMSDVASRNDVLEVKSATDVSAHVSDGGSSLDSYQTSGGWRKSPLTHQREKNIRSLAAGGSGQSTASNVPAEAKAESPQASVVSSVAQSPPMHTTTPSLCASPQLSQTTTLPPSPVPSSWAHHPSDLHSSESTRGSFGSSSVGWSVNAMSDLRSSSQRENCSFDTGSSSFTQDKSTRTSCLNPGLITSVDFPTCGICSKFLSQKSVWSSQKIGAGNELAVVAVLICGHVYHAECLETITPEFNKYDPACPVCTFGEKQTIQLARKMVMAEKKSLKSRSSKKSKNRGVDSDGSFDFDYWKSGPLDGKSPKFGKSSSLRISAAKPFLKRHFSFGSSRSNKPGLESPSIRKKGLFWAKSSRV